MGSLEKCGIRFQERRSFDFGRRRAFRAPCCPGPHRPYLVCCAPALPSLLLFVVPGHGGAAASVGDLGRAGGDHGGG